MNKRTLWLGMAVALLLARPAAAVDVRISSETLYHGYRLITTSGDHLNRNRINQYLGLDVLDLMGNGLNTISFVSSFRFDTDFSVTDAERDANPLLKNNQFSFQYAYFNFRSIGGFFDLRVGRQLLIDDMDFTLFDGGRFGFHLPYHIGLEVYAGLEVKNAGTVENYVNATQFEVDGDGGQKADTTRGLVLGGAIEIEGLRDHHGKLGYRRIMTPDSNAYVDAERLFVNYDYRILPQLHIGTAVAFDFVAMDVSEARAWIRAPGIGKLVDLEASYWRLLPVFEGSSIFNLFTLEALNDIDLRARFHITDWASAYLGGYLRLFGNEKNSQDTVDTDLVKDYGIKAGGRVRFGTRGRLGLDVTWQRGYGDMAIVDVDGGYSFLNQTLDVHGRLTTVYFADAVRDSLRGTSFGVQAGISYRIQQKAKFHVIGELNTNRIEKVQARIYALVDLDFWL